MKKLKSFLSITSLFGLTVLAVQNSSGQVMTLPRTEPVNSSISLLITDSSNLLWDVSLLTNELQNLHLNLPTGDSSSVEIRWADPFTQNGRGKLAGSGTNAEVAVMISDNGGSSSNSFIGKYASSGSISSSKGVARVTFSSRVSGTMLFPGDSKVRTVTASGVYTAKFDANNNTVTGHSSEHAAASGEGSASKSQPLDLAALSDLMPELGDGTWTLQLNFSAADGNKLSGDASVTLNSGRVYPFTFVGVYNPKSDQSKLNLKGADAGAGSRLQVTLAGADHDIVKVTGQVSGQLVNIRFK